MKLFSNLRYELHIVRTINELFGLWKTVLFISHLPTVLLTKDNRSAFNAMGECRIKILNKTVIFKYVDPRFIDEIVLRKCYTPFSPFEIKPEFIIIDAGANIGVFTIYSAIQASKGLVYSIEPEVVNFNCLKDNVVANKLTNVILINKALSNRNTTAILNVKNRGNNTLLSHQSDNPIKTQYCITITINDLMEKHSIKKVDLFKIDIEGAEFRLFDETSWLEKVKMITMEVHPNSGDPKAIIDILKNNNFSVSTSLAYDEDTIYLYAYKK